MVLCSTSAAPSKEALGLRWKELEIRSSFKICGCSGHSLVANIHPVDAIVYFQKFSHLQADLFAPKLKWKDKQMSKFYLCLRPTCYLNVVFTCELSHIHVKYGKIRIILFH